MNPQNKDVICLHYDITLACNNRCSYCYCLNELDNTKLFNKNTFEEVIDAVNSIDKEHYSVELDFLGGEPLLVTNHIREFIQRTELNSYSISSNINFNPNSIYMKNILTLLETANCKILASWHQSSNQIYFKENLLKLKDYVVATLLISDNIDEVHNQMLFVKEHNIPYDVEIIYTNEIYDVDTTNIKFLEIIQGARNNLINVVDNKKYNMLETLEKDLLNISSYYHTICQLSQIKIDYYGNINLICNNPIQLGHIKDGIKIKDLYCKDYNCRCVTKSYKRLLLK